MKSSFEIEDSEDRIVAPYTGAWIEILTAMYNKESEVVAPYTGAWIEI